MPAPTRLKDIAKSTRDLFVLDPDDIVIEEGFNARDFRLPENKEHLAVLIELIREDGIQNAVTVRFSEGKAILVDGETRLRAARALKAEGLPILVPAVGVKPGNEVDRVASLVTRNFGKPLSPIELAAVVKRLFAFDLDAAEIAKKTGLSRSYVDTLT